MKTELLIQHGSRLLSPAIEEGIEWSTERTGSPSILRFNVAKKGDVSFSEGDPVRFKVDGEKVFYGFIFTKKASKKGTIPVTAYDQLRYLKNKDTYVYANKTASQFIMMVADDFGLNCGNIEPTSFVIPSRVEDNKELFDMIQSALDLELQHKGEIFTLYDDFGKLTLKNMANMKLNVLLDESTVEDFDYSSSIDQNTYNKIKLTYDNDQTGKRDVYIAQDGSKINAWGILQYYEKLQKGENGKAKADALLKLYNKKTRNLKVNNCLGDIRCRAGAMPVVRLNLGDMSLSNYMIIERATHTFKNNMHLMSLVLRGGGI